MKEFARPVTALILTLLISACNTRDHDVVRDEMDDRSKRINSAYDQVALPKNNDAPPPLIEESAPWFGNTAVPVAQGQALPPALEGKEALVLTFEKPLTLEQVASRIQAATDIRVMVEQESSGGVGAAVPAGGTGGESGGKTFVPADGLEVTGGRMIWQGSLSGLLNQIADRFDAEWRYTGSAIRIDQRVVRTFMLHALAGSTDVSGSVESSSSGDSGGGLPEASVTNQSKIALWDEIQKSIDTIIAGKAVASYSPASGTVTVAGFPSAVRSVEDYLRLQNKMRLRRISLHTQVMSVRLNKAYDMNFDMDLVLRDILGQGQHLVLGSTAGAPRDVTAGVVRNIPPGFEQNTSTVNFIINALSAVSERVSTEYSGNLVTLSDQPAPLQVATKRAYVARVSGTSSEGSSSSTLEPGTIDLGLSMNILPRAIEQDRIMLRIALGITDLVQLREFTSGGSSVQLPEVDSTGFLQNAVLSSGETLVLAGFEKKNAEDNRNGVGNPNNWWLGGGENFGGGREIRVLLITARLLPEEPLNVIKP
jgi:type IVB pilus formation R64 PilN family outer membrane protein